MNKQDIEEWIAHPNAALNRMQIPEFKALCELALRNLRAGFSVPQEGGTPLYLWKNGNYYLAFAHEYPCFEDGDPMIFGEPAARAIFKASHNGRRKEGA